MNLYIQKCTYKIIKKRIYMYKLMCMNSYIQIHTHKIAQKNEFTYFCIGPF